MVRKSRKKRVGAVTSNEKNRRATGLTKNSGLKQTAEFEHQRLKEVLEILPAYVVLLTPDHHVAFANRFFRERFGDAKGRRCFEYLFKRSEPCETCETFTALKTNAPHHWKWTGPDERTYDVFDFPFADIDGSRLILEMGVDITERRKAEAELQELNKTLEQRVAERTAELSESEAKYRIVADNTYDFEFWLGTDDKYLYCSPSCERLTGYAVHDFFEDQDLRFKMVHPDDRQLFLEHSRNEQAQRKPGELEFRMIRKDGTMLWVHHVCQPVLDNAGVFKGTRGSNRDVTARKRAEVALFESQERYRNLFETMTEGFALDEIILDAQGKPCDLRYLTVNPAFEKQTGLKAKDVIGRTTRELFPNVEPAWFERYGEVVRTGTPTCFEEKFGPLGLWFEVRAFKVDGRRFATVFMDITERKRNEAALRESAEILKHAQEIAHLGSWELDLTNNKLLWSDEVYKIFGLKPQQFGATYEAFLNAVHPEDRAEVDAAYSGSVREGRDSYEIEHRIVRPDGETRIMHEKCYHIRDDAGKIIKSIGMVHDITAQKLQEEQRMVKVQMEAAIKELQEFLRLFETVEVALMLIEHDGTIKYANNRAKAMLQVQPNDNLTDYFDKDIISSKSFSNEIFFSKAVRRSFLVSRQDYKDMYLLVVDSMQEEIAKGKKIQSNMAPYVFDDIVGLDSAKAKARELAVQNVNILLLGESGTGKELFASAIHNASPRAGNRFVVVHCGAIPDTLFESELFGHEKGAFTDARSARTGKIEYAHGGTVFFDELGDLPLNVQSKLLRVIEDKHIVPVGSNETKAVDVRFIFATNQNLEEMVKKKEFREDLFYRINSLVIKIPPLRERKKELGDLVKHVVTKMQMTFNRYVAGISEETSNKMLAYEFPGNVRELEGMIRNAFLTSKGDKIEISDLKIEKLDRELISLKVKRYRAQLIYEHFLSNNRNYTRTAKDLQLSSRQVYRYVKMAEESGLNQAR